MNCSVCGKETATSPCVHCGHDVSGADATGRYAIEQTSTDLPAIQSLADLPAGHAALVVVRGSAVGEIWTLDSDRIDVGRADDCALFLDDITVSRHHAEFARGPEGWTLEDKGSLNGSYVNRLLISGPTVIHSGDEIQLGKFRFTFHEAS